MSNTFPWEQYPLHELEERGIATLGRGNIISKKDIQSNPGAYPIYSSSARGEGLFGSYGDYMFDEEMITWSVDGGGNLFYRPKHKFSVTNVSGFMRLDTSVLDYRFAHAALALQHSKLTFDYQAKAHPSVIRNLYHLPIPPLPEQKKIAEILSGVDRVLASSKHRIECLKLLKKALVSRHIENAENAIEESKLDDILISMDSGWSPDCLKRPPLNANEWSILKTTSVTWKGFNQEERKALPSNLVPKQELVVEKGDILVTRAGPADRTGVAAYVDKKADSTMISDKIIRLRCDRNRIDPRFLSIFLSTDCAQRQILKGKAGMASSQTNISQQLLKDMTVRFPPLPEQRHVSELVAELQGLINQVEAYMGRTEKLKTSLSADLLSGRKRVPL